MLTVVIGVVGALMIFVLLGIVAALNRIERRLTGLSVWIRNNNGK